MTQPVDDELLRYDKVVLTVEQTIKDYLDVRSGDKSLVWQYDGCIFEPFHNAKELAIRIVAKLRKEGEVK